MRKLFPMYEADKGGSGGSGGADESTDTKDEDQDTGGQDDGQDTNKDTDNKGETLSKDDILKMIQSESDKVRTEYSKKLKAKEKELEDTKKSQMSEQERAQYELDQMKDSLSKRERELLEKELTITTIDLLKENGLPLEAKSFLIGSDAEATTKNVTAFKAMFNSALEQAVQGKFKESGKEHERGDGTGTTYTHEMLKNMSQDEINKNWAKIEKDLSK